MRDFEPSYDTVMRGIATFAGRCAVEALIPRLSVFFHSFNALERLPKLATSSVTDTPRPHATMPCPGHWETLLARQPRPALQTRLSTREQSRSRAGRCALSGP